MPNNNNNLSETELYILKNIVKYVSHCTIHDYIESIIKDGKLKIINMHDFYDETGSKVFGRIIDKYSSIMENPFCLSYFSIELQLNYKILIEHKYYVIYVGGTFGNLYDAEYISDHLFQIIKKCDFNRKKFIERLKKDKNVPEITKKILTIESKELFMCEVIKNKYNPPLTYIMLRNIVSSIDRKNKAHYTPTIGFLDVVPLKRYLNQFLLSDINVHTKAIINEDYKQHFDQIINVLKKSGYKYELTNKNFKYGRD